LIENPLRIKTCIAFKGAKKNKVAKMLKEKKI